MSRDQGLESGVAGGWGGVVRPCLSGCERCSHSLSPKPYSYYRSVAFNIILVIILRQHSFITPSASILYCHFASTTTAAATTAAAASTTTTATPLLQLDCYEDDGVGDGDDAVDLDDGKFLRVVHLVQWKPGS